MKLLSLFGTFQKKKKPAAALPCAYSRLLPVSFLLQLSCIGCRLCGSGWQKEGSGRSSGRQCCCAQTLFWLLPTINIKIIPCHTNLGSPPGGCDNWQMSYFLVQCNGIMGAREATRMPRYKHLHVLHAISVSCLHFGRIAGSFQTPYLL